MHRSGVGLRRLWGGDEGGWAKGRRANEPREKHLPVESREALRSFRAGGGQVRWGRRASPLGSFSVTLEGDERSDVGWGDLPAEALGMAFERRQETPWKRRGLVRELTPERGRDDWRWTWEVVSHTGGRPKEVTVVMSDSLYRAEATLQETPGGLLARVSEGSSAVDAYLGFLEPPTTITVRPSREPEIRGHRE